MYSILEGIVNRRTFLNELGPYPILMDILLRNNTSYTDLIITAEELDNFKRITQTTIIDTIRQYERNRERRDLARRLYDDLFRIPYFHLTEIKDAQGENVKNAFHIVATLNYDQVLELYDNDTSNSRESPANKPHFLSKRGFYNNDNPRIYKLNLREILLGQKKVDYVKLHGSTDWWIDDHNNILESFSNDNPLTNIIERQIVYPIYEKYISKEPFFTLYQYFRRRLLEEDIVIVIGYSFADISINNAIIDWLKYNDRARLIVVAKESRRNLIRTILSDESNRIEFISEYFGDPDFISNLTNLLIRQ